MLRIGPHLSISKGFTHAAKEALAIGANTFQFFTRNPRGGSAKAISQKDIDAFKALMISHDIQSILAHAPYTLNLASQKDDVYIFGKEMMADDFARMRQIPCTLYNFHPGSHTGLGVDKGIEKIVSALNETLTGDEPFTVLLEGMSGKGSEIGSKFEELAAIISGVNHPHLMGVCLDTCHLYSAGYDIVHKLDDVIDEFNQVVGLGRLKAIHLNDSMVPFESHKDRHEKIGVGLIGKDALIRVINHPKLRHLPFFLETPNEADGYAYEVDLLRQSRNRL